MYQLTIEKKVAKNSQKTRQFSGALLGYLTADVLWELGGAKDVIRPIFLVLAGSEPSLRPLVANLQGGRKAFREGMTGRGWSSGARTWFEIMKSAGFTYAWQRGETAAVTISQPALFQADPGLIDPERCQFVVLTPNWWWQREYGRLLADQEAVNAVLAHARALDLTETNNVLDTPPFTPDEILQMVPQAVRFAHVLDKRTRRPILNGMAFCLQIYLAALTAGIASFSHRDVGYRNDPPWGRRARWVKGFTEEGMEQLGFLPAVVASAEQEQIDLFLSDQVRLYRAA
jgi:hypothetical protein